MSLLLNVPYEDKDEVKALGANWNPNIKKWYVEDIENYFNFQKWFITQNPDLIVLDHIYIVIGEHSCFSCHKTIPVVALATDYYIFIDGNNAEIINGDISFISSIEQLPNGLSNYLKDTHNFFRDYSKTVRGYYIANHCSNCRRLQGDWFLHNEPDGPFFMNDEEAAKALKIQRIQLPFDMELVGCVGFCSGDFLIRKHAQITKLDCFIGLYE